MGGGRKYYYNDDGFSRYYCYGGKFRPEICTDTVRDLIGTPVTSLVHCVATNDLTIYDTQIGSRFPWRNILSRNSAGFTKVYGFFDRAKKEKWDVPAMVMDYAVQNGLEYIPSVRMNDAHCVQKIRPQDNPLATKFHLENQDLVIAPQEEWNAGTPLDYVLNFAHEKVRQHRLDLTFEIIDRYGRDGIEMDWTRHNRFFPGGQARPELITDMIRRVRERLTQSARKDHREKSLIVRVAATLRRNLEAGLDVGGWIREGLVDVVVPSSPDRNFSVDLPVDEWVRAAKGTKVQIHPSPESNEPYTQTGATKEMYRAAASNGYFMGADGIYLFNLFCRGSVYRGYPLSDDAYVIIRDLCHPDALACRNKRFMAGIEKWSGDADTVPVQLSGEKDACAIGVFVGDDLAAARENGTLRGATLKILIEQFRGDDLFEIRLNNHIIGRNECRLYPPEEDDMRYIRRLRGNAGMPALWVETNLADPLPQRGENRLSIRLLGDGGGERYSDVVIREAVIEAEYDPLGIDRILPGASMKEMELDE